MLFKYVLISLVITATESGMSWNKTCFLLIWEIAYWGMIMHSFSKEKYFSCISLFIVSILRMMLWFLSDRCLTPTSMMSVYDFFFYLLICLAALPPSLFYFWSWQRRLDYPPPQRLYWDIMQLADMGKFCTAIGYVFKNSRLPFYEIKRSQNDTSSKFNYLKKPQPFRFVCWNVLIVDASRVLCYSADNDC